MPIGLEASDWIAAAGLIVAAIAAIYAYRAPLRAATEAERLRREASAADQKLRVFYYLMAERGNWGSTSMLNALNSARIIFSGNTRISDAWDALHDVAGRSTDVRPLYYDLLRAIGEEVNVNVRRQDLERFFVNPTESQAADLRSLHLQRALKDLAQNAPSPPVTPAS